MQHLELSRFESILVSAPLQEESEYLIWKWMKTSRIYPRQSKNDSRRLASARNTDLIVASHDWVTFCDPDDYLNPEYLREVFTSMEHHAQGLGHGSQSPAQPSAEGIL